VQIEIRDFSQELGDYVFGVLDGSIVSGNKAIMACQRHVDDIQRQYDDDFEFWFDMDMASRMLSIMEHLKVPVGKYANKKMEPFDYQVFMIAMIFGWREKEVYTATDHEGNDYESHLRRFREAFISFGRGNGKTPTAAVISILQVAFDEPYFPGVETYLTATKRDQAGKTFSFAKQLVEDSGFTDEGFEVFANSLTYAKRNFVKTFSSEGKSADSTETQCLIRDELHAWTDLYRKFYGKLSTSLAKRPQPLAVTITTAGSEESVLWQEEYDFAAQVLDPNHMTVDERLFVFVCEIDEVEEDPLTGKPPIDPATGQTMESDDIFDESVWPKANPAMKYGIINMVELRRMANKAKNNPSVANDLKRYHMNRLSSSNAKVFSKEVWARGHGVNFEVDRNTPTVLGIDIGYKDDLCSISWIGVCGEIESKELDPDGNEVTVKRKVYDLQSHSWIPANGHRDLTQNPWPQLIESGSVSVCQGDEVELQFVEDYIEKLRNERNIVLVYADRNNARSFLQDLQKLGLKVGEFSQTCREYHEPFKEFISAVSSGRIAHSDALLDWSADNLVDYTNSLDLKMPSKRKCKDKIDPMVAAIMAMAGAIFEKPKSNRSTYAKKTKRFELV